jgi:hypothetical protein
LVTDVPPHGRDTEHAGVCWLPDATAVRGHTTTDDSPERLHHIGRELIAEYAELGSANSCSVGDMEAAGVLP